MDQLDTLPDHIRRPDLRPVQPIAVSKDNQQLFALRDPAQLCEQTMVVPPQAMVVLQQFQGERPIEEIAAQFNGEVRQFVELVEGLDRVGLLWGPTFDKLESDRRGRIEAQGAMPGGAAQAMGSDDAECRSRMDEYFQQTEDPELEGTVNGIVAPHLDYDRGWPNYAAAYYALRGTAAPDRVIVLGTNHFGLGDGVVLSEYGFDSPMGRCPADTRIIGGLVERLGNGLAIDQLDHVGEHSIQLHLPWLNYCFGPVPIVAALMPNPLNPMAEDDGARVDGDSFIDALSATLERAGGRTLFVASADLSHVGPQFGEPRPVDDQRRMDVEQHDREMLGKFIGGDAEEFLGAFRWNRNPTSWCSLGNMTALLRLLTPETIELIDYRQAYDESGSAMVSSAALVLQ